MEVTVGVDHDMDSLWDWLRRESDLRGHVHPKRESAQPGAMGGTLELVVMAASGGTAAALVRALTTWLVQRRSDVTLTVSTGPSGRTISMSSKRVKDPERLLREVLNSTHDQELSESAPD